MNVKTISFETRKNIEIYVNCKTRLTKCCMKKCLILLSVLLALGFVACSGDSDSREGGNSSTRGKIVGKWKDAGSSNPKSYYFLKDGYGYAEYTKSDDGVFRRAFKWSLDDEVLTVEYDNDDYFSQSNNSYIVSFDSDGNMVFTNVKTNKQSSYVNINNNGTTSVDYKNPPFVNYVRSYGYYYELSKAIMSCEHGAGTQSNFKYLVFYGANELLLPYGVRFMYATPYYEGINKEWSDGSYIISSKSGHWVYGGMYAYKNSWSGRCDGKLTIKTVGKIMYLDFNLDDGDVIGHFEGAYSYE